MRRPLGQAYGWSGNRNSSELELGWISEAGVGHHDLLDGRDEGLEGGDVAVAADGSGGAACWHTFGVDGDDDRAGCA